MVVDDFANRIKELRQQQGLSQEKFALKIDMDRTYYASVEAEKKAEEKEEQDERIEKAKEERKEDREMIEGDLDAEKLQADASFQKQSVTQSEETTQRINQIMKKNHLINEDLKGIEIDVNF